MLKIYRDDSTPILDLRMQEFFTHLILDFSPLELCQFLSVTSELVDHKGCLQIISKHDRLIPYWLAFKIKKHWETVNEDYVTVNGEDF